MSSTPVGNVYAVVCPDGTTMEVVYRGEHTELALGIAKNIARELNRGHDVASCGPRSHRIFVSNNWQEVPMDYLDVHKTIRSAEGVIVMQFDDVVIPTSTAWRHLQDSHAWTTSAPGHGVGYTQTFERL